MLKLDLQKLFESYEKIHTEVELTGWIRNKRDSKNVNFIALNDGTTFDVVQIVYDNNIENFDEIVKSNIGAGIKVIGELVLTPDMKQPFEIKATNIKIVAKSTEDYPIQPKRHTMEYLRTVAHLRPRTNTFNAVFKVRSILSKAVHDFFAEENFVYLHAPILTGSDAEGAGEMFQVTTLDLNSDLPKTGENEVDYAKDFFNKTASLSVTGQLQAEAFALAFKKVYTFGPTFRAENSNTTRHAAEFWMIEPEMAFYDLKQNMEVAESLIKYVISRVLKEAPKEMDFFNNFVSKGIIDRLENVKNTDFSQITYTEAIDILEKSGKKFENDVHWGIDLSTEHEKYITDEVIKGPVFVTDYPKEIKAFYMKLNDDDKTVAAMDLLVPGIGELIGGSQREEDYDKLYNKMVEVNLDPKEYDWYLDLRRYGGVYHSGFGVGFERLIMYVTGIENIRDVSPIPRVPGYLEF